MAEALRDRSIWVFDLDNTLYPAWCDLFAQIDDRMTAFVSDFLKIDRAQARAVQKKYYADYGTTLKGLMQVHGMPPEAFLHHVHEIDLSAVPVCQRLHAAIARLPGRKYIYTNGSRRHAERVTRHMQLDHLFEGMSGIEDNDYHPKPDPRSYDMFCDCHAVDPALSVFFEDIARNLAPAADLGFATVLVQSDHDWSHEPESARPASAGDADHPHIDHVTDDLSGFLEAVFAP